MDQNKKRILIADDEPNIVSLLEDLLSDRYEIIRAYDGPTALGEIKQKRPQLVLMDMMMPGLSGFEVVRALQADPETKKIPVILVTARDFDPTTEDLLKKEGNVVHFANKPIKSADLLGLVQSILNQ